MLKSTFSLVEKNIIGIMLESNLVEGNQKIDS